jgi:hypothetical protein
MLFVCMYVRLYVLTRMCMWGCIHAKCIIQYVRTYVFIYVHVHPVLHVQCILFVCMYAQIDMHGWLMCKICVHTNMRAIMLQHDRWFIYIYIYMYVYIYVYICKSWHLYTYSLHTVACRYMHANIHTQAHSFSRSGLLSGKVSCQLVELNLANKHTATCTMNQNFSTVFIGWFVPVYYWNSVGAIPIHFASRSKKLSCQ